MVTKRNKVKKYNKTFRKKKNNKVKKYNKTFRKKSKKLKKNYKNKTKKKYLSRYNIRGGTKEDIVQFFNKTNEVLIDYEPSLQPHKVNKRLLKDSFENLNLNLSTVETYKILRECLRNNDLVHYNNLKAGMIRGSLIVPSAPTYNDYVMTKRPLMPSNLFVLIANDIMEQSSMIRVNDLLTNDEKTKIKVCRNVGYRDQLANDEEKAKPMGASMSKYHVFFTTKNPEWSYFNCLTFGIEDKKLKPAIEDLDYMLKAAKEWVKKCKDNYQHQHEKNKEQINELLKMYDIFRMTTNSSDQNKVNLPDKDIIKFVNKNDDKDIKHYTTTGEISEPLQNMNDPVQLEEMHEIYIDGVLFFENPEFVKRNIYNIYNWSDDIGYYFHVFPYNSIESLHLHIVDHNHTGPVFVSHNTSNMLAEDVLKVLKQEEESNSVIANAPLPGEVRDRVNKGKPLIADHNLSLPPPAAASSASKGDNPY